jgi:hypothetical protein
MRNINVEIDYSTSPVLTKVFGLFPDTFTTESGRLSGSIKYSVNVKTWIQTETTNSIISVINIINADGSLDSFVDEDMTECRIYENIDGTRTLLATGVVDKAILVGENDLRITLKDARKILEIPLQADLYPASETSDSGFGTNTMYALEDVVRPITIGYCKSIEPLLVNRSINEYHCHDSQVFAIPIVYDSGITVAFTLHTKGFVLTTNPTNGRIVADVQGEEDGNSPLSYIKNARQVIDYILGKISYTNYNTTDLDDIDTAKSVEYAYFQKADNATNINTILTWLMNSITGYYYTDASGVLRFGVWSVPSGTATTEITRFNVIGEINVIDDTAPNITKRLGGDRNWYVYNQDDIVFGATAQNKVDLAQQFRFVKESATALHSSLIVNDVVHDTLLSTEALIQQEATNVGTLYSSKRKFYAFDSSVSADIGETVNVTYPRFGLSAGKKLVCVGYDIDFINNLYRLILWG